MHWKRITYNCKGELTSNRKKRKNINTKLQVVHSEVSPRFFSLGDPAKVILMIRQQRSNSRDVISRYITGCMIFFLQNVHKKVSRGKFSSFRHSFSGLDAPVVRAVIPLASY